jgi:replicative DNA helicase
MSREQVIDRLVAAESQVPLWKLRTGHLNDDLEFQMIQKGLDNLSNAPIFIDDTPSPNILQMKAMARRLQIEHGLGLLVIDYLQLIAPRRNSDNMVAQVTEISRGLKGLARELNVPVLALSQLSRAVDQRDNKRPQLHDLRESGSIEQDADVVMFIYREKVDRDTTNIPAEDLNIAEIMIAKHRNGPLGTIKLKFDDERVSFKNIEERFGEKGNSGSDSTFSF